MGVYLTIMVGSRPEQARPVFASSDREVVRAALRAVMDRVGATHLAEADARTVDGDAAENPDVEGGDE